MNEANANQELRRLFELFAEQARSRGADVGDEDLTSQLVRIGENLLDRNEHWRTSRHIMENDPADLVLSCARKHGSMDVYLRCLVEALAELGFVQPVTGKSLFISNYFGPVAAGRSPHDESDSANTPWGRICFIQAAHLALKNLADSKDMGLVTPDQVCRMFASGDDYQAHFALCALNYHAVDPITKPVAEAFFGCAANMPVFSEGQFVTSYWRGEKSPLAHAAEGKSNDEMAVYLLDHVVSRSRWWVHAYETLQAMEIGAGAIQGAIEILARCDHAHLTTETTESNRDLMVESTFLKVFDAPMNERQKEIFGEKTRNILVGLNNLLKLEQGESALGITIKIALLTYLKHRFFDGEASRASLGL